jgi:hypothetical protein
MYTHIVSCFEVMLPQIPIRNSVGKRLVESYVRGVYIYIYIYIYIGIFLSKTNVNPFVRFGLSSKQSRIKS